MILRFAVALCLTAALAMSSFGHRAMQLEDRAQIDAYLLAGGDWSALCSDSDAPYHAATKCMACTIAKTCHAPINQSAERSLNDVRVEHIALKDEQVRFEARTAPYPARAPPTA